MPDPSALLLAASTLGIGGGLLLLARGVSGYRRAGRVADTATSRIGTLAVGEVRVTGRVEPAELTLVSPLQSLPCVYYRARIRAQDSRQRRAVLDDARAVGFRVRDETGSIRIFPRGAAWDVPPTFHAADGFTGDTPAGLALRTGPAIQPATPDREELAARLLSVRPAFAASVLDPVAGGGTLSLADRLGAGVGAGRREYEEGRIELGATVTVVGTALPFDQFPDPDGADVSENEPMSGPLGAAADPEIAADLEAAIAAGNLETDPDEAWGNAAIPGFGIGKPVRAPELDPLATQPAVADAPTAERFERTFEIAPTELVLAVAPGRPLLISIGAPVAAVARGQNRFVLGLLGATLAIASAVVLALLVGGGPLP
jgi:hypothetical protein